MHRNVLALCVLAMLPMAAHAGGPLYIADPDMRIPFRYATDTPVRIYADLGLLGPMTQAQAQAQLAFAAAQWTDVDTSDFAATATHTLADLGLGDIDTINADQIIGADNGGGIHVVFDHDGSILREVIGAPSGVLGMATPELAEDATLLESFVLLNGAAIAPGNIDGFAGVVTHELGHAINLAHTQTNGAHLFFGRDTGPTGCERPFDGQPATAHLETMYPYIDLPSTGVAQSTVDHPDDRVSLSNLYPAPGWKEATATIRGHVRHQDGETQLTGVNVVARNVDDPFADAVSALSGDYSQGASSIRDGSFVLRGLTPGARYALHVERIAQGGYSTPPITLPMGAASEEYWNANEQSDPTADARCAITPIVAAAPGTSHDIVLNSNGRAQSLVPVPVNNSTATDVSADGSVIAGTVVGQGAAGWRWRVGEHLETIPSYGSAVKLDATGDTAVANFRGTDGIVRAGVWNGGLDWQEIGGGALHLSSCDGTQSTPYDLSDDGTTVVGLAYLPKCLPFAFRWNAANGMSALGGAGKWTRANAISGDMRTIVGWNDLHRLFPGRQGVRWFNGRQSFINPNPAAAYNGEATAVSHDGNTIVGIVDGVDNAAWRWTREGGAQRLGILDVPFLEPWRNAGFANVVSRDGNLVMGYYGWRELRTMFFWTPQAGLVDFTRFLHGQGMDDASEWFLGAPTALSADSKTIVGWGWLQNVNHGWKLRLAEVAVCDLDDAGQPVTRTVDFPDGMNAAVSAGALLGRCDRIEG